MLSEQHWTLLACLISLYTLGAICIENVEYKAGNSTLIGNIKEFRGKTLHHFSGIPFAKPPVGNLRFKAPQEIGLEELGEIRATSTFPSCMQPRIIPGITNSEDCLYTTIWVPEKAKQKMEKERVKTPVIIIIYGGGFITGSSLLPKYDGSILSSQEDVIVVGFNYRVGIFGFLDINEPEAPGNMGFMDQQLAIKWVKKNIHYFGGDSEQITLMGFSAGSMSVSAHIVNDESRKLFSNAVMDGGTIVSTMEHHLQSQQRGAQIARMLGCNVSDKQTTEIVECLLQKSADEIIKAQTRNAKNWVVSFRPTYGSNVFPVHPKVTMQNLTTNLPKMFIGTAKLEGSMFTSLERPKPDSYPVNVSSKAEAIKMINDIIRGFELNPLANVDDYAELLGQGVIDFSTDATFSCGVLEFADALSQLGAPVYLYQFNYFAKSGSLFSVAHAQHGTGFMFEIGLPLFNSKSNEQDQTIARAAVATIGNIAKMPKNTVPPFGTKLFAKYRPHKRLVNIIEEDGSLRIQEGHERDLMCQKVWGYVLPKADDKNHNEF